MEQKKWTKEDVRAWFVGRLPDAWFTSAPEVTIDRDEILVVGSIDEPVATATHEKATHEKATQEADEQASGGSSDESRGDPAQVARLSRIEAFRDDTRDKRISIASEAETLWGRKVSWGVRCGPDERLFTTASVPVMTRLRMNERGVLDTLIDAGVARSRSDALAWCVRLVNQHQEQWIEQLRDAVSGVAQARAEGPQIA